MQTQRSFEDLGTPLPAVTFCVLDLETTGGSPAQCSITEVGALKVCCGEVTGKFHSLVRPGTPVPAFIRLLTGISDDLLVDAPPIEAVLPALLEFLQGTTIVAHNARFDVGFLNAACRRFDYPALGNRVIDTATLARKILAGEVPNNKLSTLSAYLRCAHQPSHRAFADALATVDVLHHLIERAAGFGVTTLEDLVQISSTRVDGTFSKIRLADGVPSGMGIYRFLGAGGQTLYVGKATDLRRRVRSYFYGDPRRRMRDLLRETQAVRVECHRSSLETDVAEARAIIRELPPYNRVGKRSGTWHLKVTLRGKSPKLSAARSVRDDGAVYLGPYRSMAVVRTLMDAFRDAAAVHRCTEPARCNGCAFSDMGRCDGVDLVEHRAHFSMLLTAVLWDPGLLLRPLDVRMRKLAQAERFEEAAELRERAALLERSLIDAAHSRALIDANEILIETGGRVLFIRSGRLITAADVLGDEDPGTTAQRLLAQAALDLPVAAEPQEIRVVSRWLRKHAAEVRLLHVSGSLASASRTRPLKLFEIAPN